MSAWIRSLVLALAAFSFTACSSISVNHTRAPGADLTSYRTYGWADPNTVDGSAADPARDRARVAIREEITSALFERGLSEVDGDPDLLVSFVGAISTRTNVRVTHTVYDRQNMSVTFVRDLEQAFYDVMVGRLVIFMMDRDTGEIVWRGEANTEFDERQNLSELARAATRKLMKGFP